VIHNSVDCGVFAAARPYPHERAYVAAVGQLVAHKGFDLLIEAFAKVDARFPDVDLLIAGDGDYDEELTRLIQAHGLKDRVHLLGRVDKETVASLFVGSLFVAVPSRREPFGIVALEGMAAARRVLATPVGGIPEFLPTDVNRMVEPDLDRWVGALEDWLAIPRDKDVANVPSNRVQAERFASNSVASEYMKTYSLACSSEDVRR
jgi:glycosyltransferase involved in cell wall biosynthesis